MTTRSAIVTGGASGLGAATANRLRAEGLTVTTLDLAGASAGADVSLDVSLIADVAVWRAANGIHPQDRRPTGPEQLQTTLAESQQRLDRALSNASDDPVSLDRRHEIASGTFKDRRQRQRYDGAQPSEVRRSPSGPAR